MHPARGNLEHPKDQFSPPIIHSPLPFSPYLGAGTPRHLLPTRPIHLFARRGGNLPSAPTIRGLLLSFYFRITPPTRGSFLLAFGSMGFHVSALQLISGLFLGRWVQDIHVCVWHTLGIDSFLRYSSKCVCAPSSLLPGETSILFHFCLTGKRLQRIARGLPNSILNDDILPH